MTALPHCAPCTSTDRKNDSGPLTLRNGLFLFFLTATLTGCQSNFLAPTAHMRDRMLGRTDASAADDEPVFADDVKDDRDDADLRTIDDVIGPLQRVAMSRRDASRMPTAAEKADRAELERAQDFLDKKQYASAESAYQAIIKARSPKSFKLFGAKKDVRKYDPIREEAMFYLAEAHFMQNHLPKAAAQYQAVMKDYPSTRYMDESTRRLFDIARRWLGTEDFATASEIRQVSLEHGADAQPLSSVEPEKKGVRLPNFTDKSRPVFDTTGHAVLALKSIWLNDPSGPLADDALMLAATHHLRNENYREADRLLTILREQFPKSTHLQTAFVIGSHVKLMSYQGAAYDEQLLDDAKQLKENTLRLFPNVAESDRIRREIQKIVEAKAQREWAQAEFWEKKNKPKAVAIQCREILRLYPDSQYAEMARHKLASLGEASDDTVQSRRTSNVRPDAPRTSPGGAISPFQSTPESREAPEFEESPVFEQDVPYFDDGSPLESDKNVGRVRL